MISLEIIRDSILWKRNEMGIVGDSKVNAYPIRNAGTGVFGDVIRNTGGSGLRNS
jgi:hypothetical protein